MGIILPLRKKSQFATVAGLSADVSSRPIGATADLYGPGGLVGSFESTGAGVRACGWLDIRNADASTGITWTLGSSSAPSWASPGASGGLVIPGDGDLLLDSLGVFNGSLLSVAVVGILTLTSEVDGQQIGAGCRSLAGTATLGGAAERIAGTWYRQFMIGDLSAPVIGGLVAAGYAMPGMVTGDTVTLFRSSALADVTSGTGSYQAGAYRGDEAPASLDQQASPSTANALVQRDDQTVHLYANAAAGALAWRITHIKVSGGQ